MSINISAETTDKLRWNQQGVAVKFTELLAGNGPFFDFVVLLVCDQQQRTEFETDIESRLARGL